MTWQLGAEGTYEICINLPPIALPDQMGETYLPRLQQLLYELEQPTIFTTDDSDNLTGIL